MDCGQRLPPIFQNFCCPYRITGVVTSPGARRRGIILQLLFKVESGWLVEVNK
jgi:hypothetical protein